ncbi:MAG: chromosomal replication initiator protein DnaA [Candidatus Marinimicrobia bacterium]|nr:chromosomal replication initiator protein DnaA [Candidatus Neomarinimicrobiota bacterium]
MKIKSEYKKLWGNCLKKIQSSVSEQAFETWFSSLSATSCSGDEITLQVPNRFHYEWLESKYSEILNTAIIDVFGVSLKINYSVLISQEQNEQSTSSPAGSLIPKQFHRASQLNNRYTFSNFIEGKGNQFAKAAASSVADGPGQTPFNPLVIYSNPGLGKTHLIQAIGNHILKTQPKMKVIYATSEKFMLDFINSIQNNNSTKFAQYYRNVDILILDDVQFFQSKEQTQEQFFHLFNDLFQQGKQIVLTTDRHPNELTHLKDRLVSRFQSGLIVDIQPPDLETRIAILMKKAENEKLEIPYDVTEFLAASFTDDIRMMEGAMVKILALSSLTNTDINKNLSKTVIKDILGDKAFKKITMKDICKKVSKETGISESKVYSKSRQVDIVFSRHISMYLCRQLTKNSLTHIGNHFGKRDHATIIHACKTIEEKMKDDKQTEKLINKIQSELQ